MRSKHILSSSLHACYHSVHNLLPSRLLRIYKTIILPVVLYGCEAWSLITGVLDFVHRSELKTIKQRFGNWIWFRPQVKEVT
jgi:hypothetical protein